MDTNNLVVGMAMVLVGVALFFGAIIEPIMFRFFWFPKDKSTRMFRDRHDAIAWLISSIITTTLIIGGSWKTIASIIYLLS